MNKSSGDPDGGNPTPKAKAPALASCTLGQTREGVSDGSPMVQCGTERERSAVRRALVGEPAAPGEPDVRRTSACSGNGFVRSSAFLPGETFWPPTRKRKR